MPVVAPLILSAVDKINGATLPGATPPRYFERATSMIFSTKVVNAMMSIAIKSMI
jgi:hypothetical protein